MSHCLSLLSAIRYGNAFQCVDVFACSTARAGCDVRFTQRTSPTVLMPLSNNVDYSCAITARNSLGSGPPVDIGWRPTAQLFGNGFE